MAMVIYDPILEMTRLETGMTDSGSQAFSGEKTFYDQVVQVGTDATPGDDWNIQNNGFLSDCSAAGDTGFVHATNGTPTWAEQTFRGEGGEFWYLYNVSAKANPITVSDGGRVGINQQANATNYHTTWVDPVCGALNDFEVDGVYNKNYNTMYSVSIVATGTPDVFGHSESDDAGATWSAVVTAECSSTPVPIGLGGNTCWFESVTGHNTSDAWSFTAFSQLPDAALSVHPTMLAEVNTTSDYTVPSPAWYDITHDCASVGGNENTLIPLGDGGTAKGAVYIGAERQLNSLFVNMQTAAVSATVVLEYWNGAWTQITGAQGLLDHTNGLTQSNSIRWDRSLMTDWVKSMLPGKDPVEDASYNLYWVRIRSSSVMSVPPTVRVLTPQGNTRFSVFAAALDDTPAFKVDGLGAIVLSKRPGSGSAFSVLNQTDESFRATVKVEQSDTSYNVYKYAADDDHRMFFGYGHLDFWTSGVPAVMRHKFEEGFEFLNNMTDSLMTIAPSGTIRAGTVGYEALVAADNDIPNKKYVDQLLGGNVPQGNWNAASNTPDIGATATVGQSWVVSVSGTTNLGGISTWYVGDMAIKTAAAWAKSSATPAVWGSVLGTLSAQGDLQNALNQKVSTAGLAAWNGSTSVSTLGTVSTGAWYGSRIDKNYLDATVTSMGSTFNGPSQLMQTTAAGKIPALDASLVTGLSATIVTADASGFSKTLHADDTDVQSALDTLDQHQHTVGAYDTGLVAYVGGGMIDVTSGIVYLYDSPAFAGHISRNVVPARSSVAVTPDVVSYLVADYNGGSPVFKVVTSTSSINGSSVVIVASMFYESAIDDLHFIDTDFSRATATRLNDRLINQQRFVRTSGLALAELSGRVLTVAGGNVYYGIRSNVMPAVNSSSDTCMMYYHTALGAWTQSNVSQYDNSQYDSLTGLTDLAAGDYTVNWVYRFVKADKHVAITLGTVSHTITEAKNSQPPAAPLILQRQAILVGRVIVKAGDAVATQIDSAFVTSYETTPVQDHNNLGGLQGGGADFYHLTSAEYASVAAGIPAWDSATSTVASNSATWNTVTSKLAASTYASASGAWQSTFSTVGTTSASWSDARSTLGSSSGDWESVYSTVGMTSGPGMQMLSTVSSTSGAWQSVYSTVGANSAAWQTVSNKLDMSAFQSYSGSVNSTLTAMQVTDSSLSAALATSGSWNSVVSTVASNSAGWESSESTVSSTSATWQTVTSMLGQSAFQSYSGSVNSTLTGMQATDSSLNAAITGVAASVSTLAAASGSWNSARSTVASNSATWGTVTSKLDQSAFQSYSGSVNSTLTAMQATDSSLSAAITGVAAGVSALASASGSWNSASSTVAAGSASWSAAYSSVGSNSATWQTVTSMLGQSAFQSYSGSVNSTLTGMQATDSSLSATGGAHSLALASSGSWNNAYSTASAGSANWNSAYSLKTTLDSLTGVLSGKGNGTYASLQVGTAISNLVSRPAAAQIAADSIVRVTAASGVTVEGVLHRDGYIELPNTTPPSVAPLSGSTSGMLLYSESDRPHATNSAGKKFSMPNYANYTSVVTASNSTNNSNANMADATGLSFSVEANKKYYFEFDVVYQSTNINTGIALSMSAPSSPTSLVFYGQVWSSVTTSAFGMGRANDAVAGTASNTDSANTDTLGKITGYLSNGANAGTLIVRFRSSRNGTTVSVRADSMGKLYELQ